MRRIVSTVIFVLAATLLVAAHQRSGEEEAVRKTIEDHYFKAHSTGDGAFLKETFIDEGRMMWVQDAQLRIRTSADYIAGFSGNRRLTRRSACGAS